MENGSATTIGSNRSPRERNAKIAKNRRTLENWIVMGEVNKMRKREGLYRKVTKGGDETCNEYT